MHLTRVFMAIECDMITWESNTAKTQTSYRKKKKRDSTHKFRANVQPTAAAVEGGNGVDPWKMITNKLLLIMMFEYIIVFNQNIRQWARLFWLSLWYWNLFARQLFPFSPRKPLKFDEKVLEFPFPRVFRFCFRINLKFPSCHKHRTKTALNLIKFRCLRKSWD